MRAFVAVDLEPGIKKTLQELILRLKKKDADIRWVHADGMHLTLKFLGHVPDETVPELESSLRAAVAGRSGFPLVLHGTGTFPGGRSPRVVWAGIEEEPALMELQRGIETALEKSGYPREERPFHPHLTLGRVKSQRGVAQAVAELEKRRDEEFGRMPVRKVALFESVLKPQGAEYRIVSEFELE